MLRRHKVKLKFTKEMLKVPRPIKVVSLVAFIYTLGWAMIDPFFFIYLKNLLGGYASVGIVTAILYLLAILWSLPIGQLLNRVSSKFLIAVTLVMYLPMGYLLIKLKTLMQFILFRVYNSFTAASIWVSLEDYVREHTGKKKAYESFGFFDAACSSAYVIGPILGALALTAYGFSMFFVLSVTSFIAFLIAMTLKDHKKEGMIKGINDTIKKDGLCKKEVKDFFKNKKLLRAEVLSFLFTLSGGAMAMLLPLFMNEQKATYLQIGIISSFYYLPSISESYFSTFRNKNRLIRTALAIAILVLLSMFLTKSIYLLFFLVIALSFCTTAMYTVIRGRLTTCMPKNEIGELSGVDMSIRYMAAGLGLMAAGIVAQIIGLRYVFVMVAIAMSILLLLTSKKEFKF